MTDLTGTWKLDPSHSWAGFTARHAMVTKVRGHFEEVDATVEHDGTTAAVTALLQANSFTTGNNDRDAHVKSEDFLGAETYPTVTFEGKLLGDELVGELTIRDVTRPVTLAAEVTEPVTDPFGNVRIGAEASGTISRKDFGLTWNVPLDGGGVLVSDKIKLELDLSFVKA